MILHQTIRSARAEERSNWLAPRAARHLLTALLASSLSLPSFAAWGADSLQGSVDSSRGRNGVAPSSHSIQLPPIPDLDATPWMLWNRNAPTLKTDILISPGLTPSDILQAPQERADGKAAIS